jgi:ankyrin repeat protein
MEKCQNCGRNIGNLEVANVWNNSVVCSACYESLVGSTHPAAKKRLLWPSVLFAVFPVLFIVALCWGGLFFWTAFKRNSSLESIYPGWHFSHIERHGWQPPLVGAVRSDNLDLIKTMLADEPDVNEGDADGNTSLHFLGSVTDKPVVLKMLLERGGDINIRNVGGETPLFKAMIQADTDTISALLAAGADPNAQDITHCSPIHYALSVESLSLLISHKANIEAQDNLGETALDRAAADGDVERIKFLLQNGAKINSRSDKGYTPLKCAELGFREEAAKFLKDQGGIE